MNRRVDRIGKYRLLAKLEQGGMAEVHLAAVEGQLDSLPLRALKVMPHELLADPTLKEMFLDEAKLAIRLAHPNVVQTADVGEVDGCLYLAMELLEGETVHRLVQRSSEAGEEVPLRAALAIALGVLQGLHYLHNLADHDGRPLQIVHRDITPSNLYVTTAGTVKVCDFGIAKTQVQNAVTVVGMRKGKLGYLAPEQLAGAAPDARADLYSCAVVIWELLAGRRLFRRGRDAHTPAPRLDEIAPEIPSSLANVCARALSDSRDDRHPTALAMWTDLDAVARDLGGPMPAIELGPWVERLVGEDVRNLRRLTANALRDERWGSQLGAAGRGPEPTSFTVRPDAPTRSARLHRAFAVVGAATLLGLIANVLWSGRRGDLDTEDGHLATRTPVASSSPEEEGMTPSAPEHVVLRVRPAPEGAHVTLDGNSLPAPHETRLDAGTLHRLRVEAPGYLPRHFDIDATSDLLVHAVLAPEPVAPPPTTRPRAERSRIPAHSSAAPSASPSSSSPTSAPSVSSPPSRTSPPPRPRAAPGVRALDLSDPW